MSDSVLKVLCVFGTRPEAIKMAPVVRELQRRDGRLRARVCVTGQHREMLDQVLTLFGIVPDHDLKVMRSHQSLSGTSAAILTGLDPVLAQEQPDWLVVQGDTSTAMAAALAGFYHGVKVAHVEAGLRTGDNHQPFPEEINRKIVDTLCDLHFAPTQLARRNLLSEGVSKDHIVVTGNTSIDALHWASQMSEAAAEDPGIVVSGRARVVLVTAHRHESFGSPLEGICVALRRIAERYHDDAQIVFPVHLNPEVQQPVQRLLGGIRGISLVPPLDYLHFVRLLKRAYLVLTDSGGIQEEAPALGKPILVLRNVTERPEGVDAGTARVVGTDPDRIVSETITLLEDRSAYEAMARAVNPYGDGWAADRIVKALTGDSMSEFDEERRMPEH